MPSDTTIRRRYKKVKKVLDMLEAQHKAAQHEFENMKGLPNEIAAQGGIADGLQNAVVELRAALETKKK